MTTNFQENSISQKTFRCEEDAETAFKDFLEFKNLGFYLKR